METIKRRRRRPRAFGQRLAVRLWPSTHLALQAMIRHCRADEHELHYVTSERRVRDIVLNAAIMTVYREAVTTQSSLLYVPTPDIYKPKPECESSQLRDYYFFRYSDKRHVWEEQPERSSPPPSSLPQHSHLRLV